MNCQEMVNEPERYNLRYVLLCFISNSKSLNLLECCDKFQILRIVITNYQVRYDSVKE